MTALFPKYGNFHISYNENEHINLLQDQLENRIAGLNGEILELYVMIYMTSLFSICILYTIYIFLS